MASALPSFPKTVFTIIEPITLVAGFFGAILDPEWFIAEQVPLSLSVMTSDNARVVALQLGNLYLLMAMVGIAVLSTTNEIKVVRSYLIALWVADIGHVGICYHVLGHARFLDLANWNAMTWGNVGVTVSSYTWE